MYRFASFQSPDQHADVDFLFSRNASFSLKRIVTLSVRQILKSDR